jgi:hypothetical protein
MRNYVHTKRIGSRNEYRFFSMTLLQICGPDNQEVVVRLPAGGAISVPKIIHIDNGFHLASNSVGSDNPFPGRKSDAAWS